MTNAALGHHRNGNGVHDLEDHFRVTHTRHTPIGTDIGGNAFQRHNGARAGVFSYFGVLGVDHIHDHPAFQHLRQSLFNLEGTCLLFHIK